MLERNLRPASALFQRALELDCSESLEHPRPTEQRVVGTCRHFAVLATAFLRAVGVPARARCGFATYFIPPKQVDHWIVEYWSEEDRRWVRVDPEYIDRDTPGSCRPEDLRLGEFLDAGEAWQHPTRRCTFPAVGGTLWTGSTEQFFAHGVDVRSSRSAPSGRSNRQLRVRGWRDLGPPTSLLPTTRREDPRAPDDVRA